MEANSSLFRHWEDVVFENRNKNYGAYLLRKAYADRLLSGLCVTLLFVALILLLHSIYSREEVRVALPPPLTGPDICILPPPTVMPKTPRHVVQPPRQTPQRNQAVVVTRDEVVEQEEVDALEEYISQDDFGAGDLTGVTEGTGNILSVEVQPVMESGPVDFAEVMPHYEGGLEAMMKFIRKKIRYPRAPRDIGIDGTVYVRFVVNGDGSVSQVEIVKGVHPDYDEEAIRVISMLPSWKGGSHNGRPVGVRMVLPIRFNLK